VNVEDIHSLYKNTPVYTIDIALASVTESKQSFMRKLVNQFEGRNLH